jgi:hypothetical protein
LECPSSGSSDAHRDDAATPVVDRPAQRGVGAGDLPAAHDVGNQRHPDPPAPPPLVDRLSERGGDLVAVAAVPQVRRDREVHLAPPHVLHRLLGEEIEREQPEVLGVAQAARARDVDLDELVEVAEPEPAPDPRLVVGGERHSVLAGEVEQRRGSEGPLEVDVELHLRHREQEALGAAPPRRGRTGFAAH